MAEKGTLTLSDGDRTLETVGATTAPNGVWLASFEAPIFEQENTYAESESSEGARRIRTRDKNAMAKATWYVGGADTDAFWNSVDDLQELIQSMHDRGGTLAYAPAGNGDAVTFDNVSAQITDFPQRGVLLRSRHAEITAQFECKPYAMLTPVEIVTAAVVDAPVAGIVIEDVTGYVRARALLELTEQDSVTRQHIEVGLEEDYDPTDPAPLYLSLNTTPALVTAGYAGASTTRSGSYATNVVRATLATTPVVVCSTGPIVGTGLKKLRARVYASAAGTRVRASWRVGDAPFTAERWVAVPAAVGWFDIELAIVKIDPVPAGDHSYEVRVEAYAAAVGDTIDVDIAFPLPSDVYARARALAADSTADSLLAYDDFSGIVGAITGDTSSSGHVWADMGGVSDAVDFSKGTGNTVVRTEVSDANTGIRYGRGVVLGAGTPTNVRVSVDISATAAGTYGPYQGVFARFADNDNFLIAAYYMLIGQRLLFCDAVVGGTSYGLGAWMVTEAITTSKTLVLRAFASGAWGVSLNGVTIGSGLSSILATGGALASGKSGLFDWHIDATASTRTYSNFIVDIPAPDDAVLFADGAFRLTHESAIRESDDGTSWGRVPQFDGQYLTLPPATRADRQSRLAIKTRRYDVDSGLPCLGGTDECLADLTITPRARLLGYTPPGS